MMRLFALALVAWATVAAATAAPSDVKELNLPFSTGGVRTSTLTPEGTGAFFTNDTGTVFKVNWETLEVEASGTVDVATYGIVYYAFLSLAFPSDPFLYLSTSGSYLIQIDTTDMTFAGALDLSAHLRPGWGGGFATVVQKDTAWLTGNYSVVQVALGRNMQYMSTVNLITDGEQYEPLCGDISIYGKLIYWGSAVGNRTSGKGGVTVMGLDASPPTQWFLPLGEQLHWPFQVVSGVGDNYVYVFATGGVGVLNTALAKVTSFTPSKTPLHELMCFNGAKSIAIVSSTSGGWQVWKLADGTAKMIQNLGAGTTTSHLSCALYPATGSVALGIESPAGKAVVVKTTYNPFAQ